MTWEEMRQELANLKTALSLDHTPIGIAFVPEALSGLSRPDRPVPSGCSFWRMAERDVIFTAPEDHNCPIGVMTMGFQLAPEKEPEAKALLDLMCDCAYISPEELSQIPGVERSHYGIVYGPLGQMPVEPDVAFFVCRPGQAMMLAEAMGSVAWKGGPGTPAFGRPACATIPMALKTGVPSMSLG
ncbi:MAG: DUF169 domain-containing protein [Chloroflexi bacterium]|nr:DUF169 domain-containing protein [Chloroflexota bacterium]